MPPTGEHDGAHGKNGKQSNQQHLPKGPGFPPAPPRVHPLGRGRLSKRAAFVVVQGVDARRPAAARVLAGLHRREVAIRAIEQAGQALEAAAAC